MLGSSFILPTQCCFPHDLFVLSHIFTDHHLSLAVYVFLFVLLCLRNDGGIHKRILPHSISMQLKICIFINHVPQKYFETWIIHIWYLSSSRMKSFYPWLNQIGLWIYFFKYCIYCQEWCTIVFGEFVLHFLFSLTQTDRWMEGRPHGKIDR